MKVKSFTLLAVTICFMQACDNQRTAQSITPPNSNRSVTMLNSKKTISLDEYNNTKGFWENGQLITEFDCPDSKFFPPVNIKQWYKVPVVNGRFPSYEETKNGTAIHHYGEKANPYVKPYNMLLPKLALYHNHFTKTSEMVIVIQIAQTAKDTVVGFRYLSGGVGGNTFSHFHFLTDDEVKKAVQ